MPPTPNVNPTLFVIACKTFGGLYIYTIAIIVTYPSHCSFKCQSSMTISHHKLLTREGRVWPMDELIYHRDSICSFIHKKCHPKSYHRDIKYHMTLNIICIAVSIYDHEDSRLGMWMYHNNNYLEPCFLVSTSYICSSEVHNVHHWPTWMVLQLLGGNHRRCHCSKKLFGSPHRIDVMEVIGWLFHIFPCRPNVEHNFKQHACEIGASDLYIQGSRLGTSIYQHTHLFQTMFSTKWFSATRSAHHRPT